MLETKLEKIYEKMEKAAIRAGRKKEEIELLAVTKTVPTERIREAIRVGIRLIGESKVQEALDKYPQLHPSFPKLQWHFIGHLQRNKVNRAVELFDCIQSVDSIALLDAIERRASELQKTQEFMIEVKVSEEPTKFGLLPEELEKVMDYCKKLKNVKCVGMMTLAPYFNDSELSRPYFAKAKQLFDKFFSQLTTPHLNPLPFRGEGESEGYPILSMGMSHDFEVAIEEGSTMIRIGTALFGERN